MNRTLTLQPDERAGLRSHLTRLNGPTELGAILDRIVCQDLFDAIDWLPPLSVDLIFADPPYNLTKSFNGRVFSKGSLVEYEQWLESWVPRLLRTLKPTGSIYFCADWRSSAAVHRILDRHVVVRNRITWEREKGRGALRNWKNCSEDIWFCTVSDSYTFDPDAVRVKRRVLAPYTDDGGEPKDWIESDNGRYRLTAPSNLWTDLTVPFWSMPENTDHPTQKPEKLLAKILLASTRPENVVLDPFLGSGTTAVVCRKLNRHFVGLEIDDEFCCLAQKRLTQAERHRAIQGFDGEVFWERNSVEARRNAGPARKTDEDLLFPSAVGRTE